MTNGTSLQHHHHHSVTKNVMNVFKHNIVTSCASLVFKIRDVCHWWLLIDVVVTSSSSLLNENRDECLKGRFSVKNWHHCRQKPWWMSQMTFSQQKIKFHQWCESWILSSFLTAQRQPTCIQVIVSGWHDELPVDHSLLWQNAEVQSFGPCWLYKRDRGLRHHWSSFLPFNCKWCTEDGAPSDLPCRCSLLEQVYWHTLHCVGFVGWRRHLSNRLHDR